MYCNLIYRNLINQLNPLPLSDEGKGKKYFTGSFQLSIVTFKKITPLET